MNWKALIRILYLKSIRIELLFLNPLAYILIFQFTVGWLWKRSKKYAKMSWLLSKSCFSCHPDGRAKLTIENGEKEDAINRKALLSKTKKSSLLFWITLTEVETPIWVLQAVHSGYGTYVLYWDYFSTKLSSKWNDANEKLNRYRLSLCSRTSYPAWRSMKLTASLFL